MLSLLIAAVLHYSPTIARALASPIGGLLSRVIGHHFGASTGATFGEIANLVNNHPAAEALITNIEREHGDILNTYTGNAPPMMEQTITQKFYYGEPKNERPRDAQD